MRMGREEMIAPSPSGEAGAPTLGHGLSFSGTGMGSSAPTLSIPAQPALANGPPVSTRLSLGGVLLSRVYSDSRNRAPTSHLTTSQRLISLYPLRAIGSLLPTGRVYLLGERIVTPMRGRINTPMRGIIAEKAVPGGHAYRPSTLASAELENEARHRLSLSEHHEPVWRHGECPVPGPALPLAGDRRRRVGAGDGGGWRGGGGGR